MNVQIEESWKQHLAPESASLLMTEYLFLLPYKIFSKKYKAIWVLPSLLQAT